MVVAAGRTNLVVAVEIWPLQFSKDLSLEFSGDGRFFLGGVRSFNVVDEKLSFFSTMNYECFSGMIDVLCMVVVVVYGE